MLGVVKEEINVNKLSRRAYSFYLADFAKRLRWLQTAGPQLPRVVDLRNHRLTVTKHQLVSF